MLEKIVAICVALAMVLLITLLHITNPTTVGPFGILMLFILMYLLALGVLTFLLYLGGNAAVKIASSLRIKRPTHSLTFRKSYYFSSVVALAPIIFIAMQSVGEIGTYDIILVALFVVVACVYISKRTI
jgi:hypothetical protein